MAAMERTSSPSLESLLSLFPVAGTFSQYLPVGDLITLARLNVALRSVLHGFEIPEAISEPENSRVVRTELNIGHHATPYWQRLKGLSPFECSSNIHTKGPPPRPCRYCSRPICDACIVRSSFARGHENTFQNRIRHLCKKCWGSGNPSRTQRFPLEGPSESTSKGKWYDPEDRTRDYCVCTLKWDGWLCVECKDAQNWEAVSSADTECHGQDCKEPLDADDKDRRRICLWCEKALPRQIGGTTRYHWNQKMIEARARNAASRQADIEEYNRRRLKLMRMSRREMRGDEAVKDDPDADLPQFVRHLDTINYRSYMSESAAPSGNAVYGSKRGYWRYTREFLVEMGRRCRRVPVPDRLNAPDNVEGGGLRFARTNLEKAEDLASLTRAIPRWTEKRLTQWCTLKAIILEHLLVERLSYDATRRIILDEYGLDASVGEYHKVMRVWNNQDAVKEHRRKSLDREGEDGGRKARRLARQVRDAMTWASVLHAEDGEDLSPQSPSSSSEGEPAGDYELASLRGGSGTDDNQAQPSNSDDKTTFATGGNGGGMELSDQLRPRMPAPAQEEAKPARQKSTRRDREESLSAEADAHEAQTPNSDDKTTSATSGGRGGGCELGDQLRPRVPAPAEQTSMTRGREESSSAQADVHAAPSSPAQSCTAAAPEPSRDDTDHHTDTEAAPVQGEEGGGTFPDTSVEGADEVGPPPRREEEDEQEDDPPPYTANGWVWP